YLAPLFAGVYRTLHASHLFASQKLVDARGVLVAEMGRLAHVALALGGLLFQNVAGIGMPTAQLALGRALEALFGPGMCLHLRHEPEHSIKNFDPPSFSPANRLKTGDFPLAAVARRGFPCMRNTGGICSVYAPILHPDLGSGRPPDRPSGRPRRG